jgi:tetratricopeptide (TPR) repeat protein
VNQSATPVVSASDGEMIRLKRLFERNPTSTIFARLADAYLTHGEVEEAIRVCRRGLKYRPSYVTGHIVLGRSLLESGDLAAAEDEFYKVLTLEPDHLAAIRFLSTIATHHGDQDRSDLLRRRLRALDPFVQGALDRDVQPEAECDGVATDESVSDEVVEKVLPDDPAADLLPAESEPVQKEADGAEFPFVSLTLARLYARQGHRGQAERVVRLVSPADADDILSRISKDSAK